MIKNLLWKQAMKLAKKKFGDLNTNEANKWLVDKYNALLGKENTKNIANKIRDDLKRDRPFDNWKPEVVENDPFKNLRGNESFDELLELGGNKIKKFIYPAIVELYLPVAQTGFTCETANFKLTDSKKYY